MPKNMDPMGDFIAFLSFAPRFCRKFLGWCHTNKNWLWFFWLSLLVPKNWYKSPRAFGYAKKRHPKSQLQTRLNFMM